MCHDFHFVLDQNLKNSIEDFAVNRQMSLSGAVKFIFNFMKPVLEKCFLKDVVCKKPGYCCFGADKDMHVYLKKTDYKYLRQIQSNLYCFSIAMVLRWVLNEFFDGVSRFGFVRFCKVVKRFGKIHLGKISKFKNKSKKQHMYYSIHNFKFICHIFDCEYNLLKTKHT